MPQGSACVPWRGSCPGRPRVTAAGTRPGPQAAVLQNEPNPRCAADCRTNPIRQNGLREGRMQRGLRRGEGRARLWMLGKARLQVSAAPSRAARRRRCTSSLKSQVSSLLFCETNPIRQNGLPCKRICAASLRRPFAGLPVGICANLGHLPISPWPGAGFCGTNPIGVRYCSTTEHNASCGAGSLTTE
jgi:hypothetical protein